MKTLFKFSILLCIMLSVLSANAKETGKYTKEKTINKSAVVNPDATLRIDNKYGTIAVTLWNENKIEVTVTIKVSSDDEKWVNNRIENIDVGFSIDKNLFAARTIFSESRLKSGQNSSMEINYTIKIPKNASVELKNQYGNIITHDINGNASILCQYGKITLGKLNSSLNNIKIDYCNHSSIEEINEGNIEAKYSGLSIKNLNSVNLKSSYTDVVVNKGNHLVYNSNYGKVSMGYMGAVNGRGNYLTIHIDGIEETLSVDTKYSKLNVNQISGKAKDVTINAGYTNVVMGYAINYAFDLEAQLDYGNLKTDSFIEIREKNQTHSKKEIKGHHLATRKNKISIRNAYGNITLKRL